MVGEGNFKIQDILKLIREGKRSGVARLQLGEFSVEFKEEAAKDSGPNLSPDYPGQDAGMPETSEVSPQINLFDESEILEMEKSQQLIDDPAGFEIDQIRSHIENQRQLAGEPDEKAQA